MQDKHYETLIRKRNRVLLISHTADIEYNGLATGTSVQHIYAVYAF